MGAGAAGCAAALLLARAKIPVLLIDDVQKEDSHRVHKIGESIPAAVVRLLHRLELGGLSELLNPGEYRECVANASSWGSDEWEYRNAITNPEGPGWIVLRERFDAALLQAAISAGTAIKQGRVIACREFDSEFEVEIFGSNETIVSRHLVDATGRSAKLGRALGGRSEQFSRQVAAVAWFSANSDPDRVIRIRGHASGWWYSSVLPTGERVVVSHGLASQIRPLAKDKELFVRSFNECRVLDNDLDYTEILNPIRTTDAGARRLYTAEDSNLLAVGDAILSFDPLAAQGIFFALYSAIFAAEAIVNCTHGKNRRQEWGNYFAVVNDVSEQQRSLRQSFYLAETRFSKEEYWLEQRKF